MKPSHKYLIFDRDQKFGFEVIAAVKATRIIPKRTSFRSPWQNGIAERWVGSCRRDLLDHMVALNERHLKRLLSEYVRYHHGSSFGETQVMPKTVPAKSVQIHGANEVADANS